MDSRFEVGMATLDAMGKGWWYNEKFKEKSAQDVLCVV